MVTSTINKLLRVKPVQLRRTTWSGVGTGWIPPWVPSPPTPSPWPRCVPGLAKVHHGGRDGRDVGWMTVRAVVLLFFPRSRGDEPRRSDGSPAELQHFGMPSVDKKMWIESTAARGMPRWPARARSRDARGGVVADRQDTDDRNDASSEYVAQSNKKTRRIQKKSSVLDPCRWLYITRSTSLGRSNLFFWHSCQSLASSSYFGLNIEWRLPRSSLFTDDAAKTETWILREPWTTAPGDQTEQVNEIEMRFSKNVSETHEIYLRPQLFLNLANARPLIRGKVQQSCCTMVQPWCRRLWALFFVKESKDFLRIPHKLWVICVYMR